MYYGGYTIDDTGIRVWPFRRYKLLWKDVGAVTTTAGTYDNALGYRTHFFSANDKELQLQWRRLSTFSRLRRYSQVLDTAARACADRSNISDKTKFLIEWAPRSLVLRKIKDTVEKDPRNISAILALANTYWVRLEFGKAKKAFETALKVDSRNVQALRSLALIELHRDKGPKEATRYLETAAKYAPEDREINILLCILYLGQDMDQGLELADHIEAEDLDNTEVAQHLAQYHVRHECYDKAVGILTSLLQQRIPENMRGLIQERIDFIRRYAGDPAFRKREDMKLKAKKVYAWAMVCFAVLVVVLQVGSVVLGFFEKRDRQNAARLDEKKLRETMEQLQTHADRDFEDLQKLFHREPVELPKEGDPPFQGLYKMTGDDSRRWTGSKADLVKLFNAERDRLGSEFVPELWKFVGDCRERHYWCASFLNSESYLDGRKPMPDLSLQLLNKGIEICIRQNAEKPDIDTRVDLLSISVCAATLSQTLDRREEAIQHKTRVEALLKKEPILAGGFPARSKEDIDIYAAIPVAETELPSAEPENQP